MSLEKWANQVDRVSKLITGWGLLIFSVMVSGCGPTRAEYRVVNPLGVETWSDIQQYAGRVSLTTFTTGELTVPTWGMLDLGHPKTQGITQESMDVEVYAHWIRHPIKGDFLIDTGLDYRFGESPQGSQKGVIASVIIEGGTQRPGQDIGSQLRANGVTVNGVFLTHVHSDHSAGIPALPRGTPIVLGKGASLHQYPGFLYNDHFDDVAVLYELDASQGITVDPLGKMVDLLGDGSLWAVSTPGHTEGHLSYLVNTEEGWVLLTGDASHTRWGFENQVIPGWSEDSDAANQSLNNLVQFSAQNPNVRVVYGHER